MRAIAMSLLFIAAAGSSLLAGRILLTDEPKPTATFQGRFGFVNSVAFSADGKTLASGGQYQTITLWEIPGGKEQATLGLRAKAHVYSVALDFFRNKVCVRFR
jgi:WD40 repeat protein